MNTSLVQSRRCIWLRLSIITGNIIQLTGLALGCTALLAASLTRSPLVAVVEMLIGWMLLYLCCHAIAHWLVGRSLGIRFHAYTIGGTGNPHNWPIGLKWLFEHIPFFGVQTERASRQKATANARAAMWSAGVTSSAVVPLLGAFWAWRLHIVLGGALLIFSIIWSVGTVVSNFRPGGDYFKARHALKEDHA